MEALSVLLFISIIPCMIILSFISIKEHCGCRVPWLSGNAELFVIIWPGFAAGLAILLLMIGGK